MKVHPVLGLLAWVLMASAGRASAADAPEKWFVVEGVVNEQSSFMLRVDVDKPDRVYREGDTMTVRVRPEKDCYLYLLYYGAGNSVACLFPNQYQKDNFVRADQTVTVPAPGASFRIVARPPFGSEILQVVGTLTPVDILNQLQLTKGPATELETDNLKDMVIELRKRSQQDWAEARIQITTVGGGQEQPGGGKRYAVCVGTSEYQHERIPRLQVAHKDAERMGEALRRECQVEDVTVLTNSQATRHAIEKAIFRDLVRKSKPGDTVFIFFSCHGGRTADTNGDEQDGFDEYLVPYDGVMGSPETMILDDAFARWMRELDGRKIAIILDNCYAGGASKAAKGLGQSLAVAGSLDFFDGELMRAKDLGQADTVILAACQANQLAWEMPGSDEGSVLTYNILKSLAEPTTDRNGDGRLSVGEVYNHIRTPVEDYVRRTFSAEQNPVLLDNAKDSVVLKP